jgi:hypothetical protein
MSCQRFLVLFLLLLVMTVSGISSVGFLFHVVVKTRFFREPLLLALAPEELVAGLVLLLISLLSGAGVVMLSSAPTSPADSGRRRRFSSSATCPEPAEPNPFQSPGDDG